MKPSNASHCSFACKEETFNSVSMSNEKKLEATTRELGVKSHWHDSFLYFKYFLDEVQQTINFLIRKNKKIQARRKVS